MNKNEVKREGLYFYAMPNWRKLHVVQVKWSSSYSPPSMNGEFFVNFDNGHTFPVRMVDIPQDAQFFEYENFRVIGYGVTDKMDVLRNED